MTKRAAIIGGGITGLTLSYLLLKKGLRTTVFEKKDHLGGLLSTFPAENGRLEKFYHHFFVQDAAAYKLLSELGLADKLVWAHPRMGFYSHGRIHSFTTPLDLLKFSPLSLADRIKFGLFSLKAKQVKDWLPLENITAKQWLIANLGENVYHQVWQPMLRAKFGSYADSIPASFAWFRLKARSQTRGKLGLREKLAYLCGSSQVLIDALVQKIKERGGEFRLNSGSSSLPLPGFDLTIVTTPNAYAFSQIKYLGAICVIFKLRKRFSDNYWINVADEELPFCVVVEQTNAFNEPGFNGRHLIYASTYLDHHHFSWTMSDQEIAAEYFTGLKRINPKLKDSNLLEYFIFREKFAQPVPTLGHSKKIPPFKIADKLYYVSNAQIYPEDRGVSDSIRLAKRFVITL